MKRYKVVEQIYVFDVFTGNQDNYIPAGTEIVLEEVCEHEVNIDGKTCKLCGIDLHIHFAPSHSHTCKPTKEESIWLGGKKDQPKKEKDHECHPDRCVVCQDRYNKAFNTMIDIMKTNPQLNEEGKKKVQEAREFFDQPKCENGFCKTPESPVTYGPDPFRSEIHNNDTEVWECEKCRHESAMDI